MAGAVDQDLIPDAARVAVDDDVFREVESRGELGDYVFCVVGDAFALVMIDDRNDVAMNGAAVDGA
jgi:hypothetical protein